MKKLIIVLLMFVSKATIGQINLEAIYPNASGKHFEFIRLDSNDYKYVLFDPLNSQFTLYNLNHSIYLNVSIPIIYVSGSSQYTIAFITKSLFDCDSSNIEYALSFLGDGVPTSYPKAFYLYRTDGTQVSHIDSCCFMNYSDGWKYGPEYNKPIVNTPTGSKLILRHLDGSARIYSVCGTLMEANLEINNQYSLENPFPNPTNNFITIPYELPLNENIGTVRIYDSLGNEVKSYNVDHSFKDLTITTSYFKAGTYYVQLVTSKGVIGSKRIIKVK